MVRSRSRVCATSSQPRGATPRLSSSTSTRSASPSGFRTTRACLGSGKELVWTADHWLVGFLSRLVAALPSGRTLPPEIWRQRHAWMLKILWAHAVVLLAWGLVLGHPLWHAAIDALPIAVCAVLASRTSLSRLTRSSVVSLGLLISSAVVVHLMNGAIEGHFHFFVMVSLLALYEEWFPYLLSLAFVLGHHVVMSALAPASVFANHPDAIA